MMYFQMQSLVLLLFLPSIVLSGVIGNWILGSNSTNRSPTYGTQGIFATTNTPGSRERSTFWIDSSNTIWLFGGKDNNGSNRNDLWRYNSGWTWISGSNTSNDPGNYSSSGRPPARDGAISWRDSNNTLWLFGGKLPNNTTLNDLWSSNGTHWFFMGGNSSPSYGTIENTASTNLPPQRTSAVSWIGLDNTFWMFGGESGANQYRNDMWKYNRFWTWMTGSSLTNQMGTNAGPGARTEASGCSDSSGNMFLFGGFGLTTSNLSNVLLNDLWKFNGTWSIVNNYLSGASYGRKYFSSSTNYPGGRQGASCWMQSLDTLWLFGGFGTNGQSNGYLNDLWSFNLRSNTWTWVSGEDTLNSQNVFGNIPYLVFPGSRSYFGAVGISSQNRAYIFGGRTGNVSTSGVLDDLWILDLEAIVTTAQLTTSHLTTNQLTTSPLTTSPSIISPFTTSSLTTDQLTTSPVTTSPLTTSPLTTSPLTTTPQTTSQLTTGDTPTTSPLTTSRPVTSGSVTTRGITTSRITSGLTTSERPLSTGTTKNGVFTTGSSKGDQTKENNKGSAGAIVGASLGIIVMIIIIVILLFLIFRKKTPEKKNTSAELDDIISDPPRIKSDTALLFSHPLETVTPINDTRHSEFQACISVKEVGISYDQNPNYRRTMEDEHIFVDRFGGKEDQFYVGVYDGHGGKLVAEQVRENLHKNFEKELESGLSVEESFNKAFLNTDALITEKCGSTAAVAFITSRNGIKTLYTANCGDARIVLKRGYVAQRLTIDHKASDPDEQKRINELGGLIFNDKVGASLAVTRAFGDAELKKWVKAEPYVNKVELTTMDTHLIVACDGLWDVVSDDEAVGLVGNGNARQDSDRLLTTALDKATKDNVSIIVVVI